MISRRNCPGPPGPFETDSSRGGAGALPRRGDRRSVSSPSFGGAAGAGSENPSKKKGGRIVVRSSVPRRLEEGPERLRLRRPNSLEDAGDRTRRDSSRLAALDPRLPDAGLEDFFEDRDERCAVRHASLVRGKARIRGELRPPEDPFTENLELPVGAHGEEKGRIRGLEQPVGLDRAWELPCRVASRPVTRAEPATFTRPRGPSRRGRLHVRAGSVPAARVEGREDLRERRPAREDVRRARRRSCAGRRPRAR